VGAAAGGFGDDLCGRGVVRSRQRRVRGTESDVLASAAGAICAAGALASLGHGVVGDSLFGNATSTFETD
jgi:hypothetical protein